jgi:hypothetical protein
VASGPVDVPALPEAEGSTRSACAQLLAALPAEIDPGVGRRPVTGDPERIAAYGDPAVVVRCGVPAPERITEAVQINRVDWSVRDSGAGFEWTTVGRAATVSVELPDVYEERGFAELIVPLTGPITATLPAPTPTPTPTG